MQLVSNVVLVSAISEIISCSAHLNLPSAFECKFSGGAGPFAYFLSLRGMHEVLNKHLVKERRRTSLVIQQLTHLPANAEDEGLRPGQ